MGGAIELEVERSAAWAELERGYRDYLRRRGASERFAANLCARMKEHFVRANVQFCVNYAVPIPEVLTATQASDIIEALADAVEGVQLQMQEHTRKLMWEIFHLELEVGEANNRRARSLLN